MLESPTSGGGAYGPALKKATAQRTASTPKKFGLADIAKGLANPTIQGAAAGTDVAGGESVAKSVQNVASGKGTAMDALNLGLAAASFTGLGGAAAKASRPLEKIAAATFGKYGKDAEQAAEVATAGIALKKPKIAVNIRQSTLADMLSKNSLDYKNTFDPTLSTGRNNIMRAEGEARTMGIPLDAPAADRPIYGYLVGKNMPDVPYSQADDLKKITQLFTPETSYYGDTAMVLKNSANKRSTFSYGDSLGNSFVPGFKPAPLDDVAGNLDASGRAALNASLGGYPRQPYLEAQIFGGINVAKDVKKFVTQYRAQVPDLQKAVKDAGLNIKVSSIEKAADNPALAASKKLFAQMAAALKKKPELKTQQTLLSPEG